METVGVSDEHRFSISLVMTVRVDPRGVRTAARKAARVFSPRYRRWRRLLNSLTLDPDMLPRPIAPIGPNDFLMCGASRSGTSLLCAALFQPPRSVTVLEPWDGMRLRPSDLVRSLRSELEETGRLSRGKLDVTALRESGIVRWCPEGTSFQIRLGDDYRLGIKWPAFWRYLEHLPEARFLVCVRHPVEVIASFRQTGGRLAEGLDYDIAFNRRMNGELQASTRSRTVRRILLYDYVNSRILPHLSRPNVLVVRYERWFSERDALLSEISDFLGVDLSSSLATIRRPERTADVSAEEMRMIREWCRTAEPLGYEL
jgi:Sulfotransferase family